MSSMPVVVFPARGSGNNKGSCSSFSAGTCDSGEPEIMMP